MLFQVKYISLRCQKEKRRQNNWGRKNDCFKTSVMEQPAYTR